jgi:hypothetical protein
MVSGIVVGPDPNTTELVDSDLDSASVQKRQKMAPSNGKDQKCYRFFSILRSESEPTALVYV